jgi:hypothetical protein
MNTIRLYHFCPRWMLNDILKQGLTLGKIPYWSEIMGSVQFVRGYQWLTKNSDWKQSWCEHSTLPYRRDEVRLTVELPQYPTGRILPWLEYCLVHPDQLQKDLNAYGDPWNWVLFRGNIEPGWIEKHELNPSMKL